MGVYAKHILPHLINLAMKHKDAARLREAWIPLARGHVLEVGIGSGLNLPFYSTDVRRVVGVDPSLELQRMARKRAAAGRLEVEFLAQSAEAPLPLGNQTIDTVVSTWTLCSIPDAARALAEMRRVLRSDGTLIFIEHGHAPDPRVATWQERLTPLWERIAGGCHLNRKIDQLLESAGFHITRLDTGYLPGPRPMTYIYGGLARGAA